MPRAPKEKPGPTYRCPHCGDQIRHLPGNHEFLVCNHCRHRYMVMIDQQTGTVAFVDQAEKSGPEPLWLPKGSIRAMVAMALVVLVLALVVRGGSVPAALTSLLLTVVGFYFGFRMKSSTLGDRLYDPTASRDLPLYMPPGVIRAVLVLCLAAAWFLLTSRGRLGATQEQMDFFTILTGLAAGHYFTKVIRRAGGGGGGGGKLGHVKALAVLALMAALAAVYMTNADASMPHWSVMALCGTISFYFGSRS